MTIELQSPLDMHLHLREGPMLDLVAPLSALHFAGGVVMPNLVSPIDSAEKLRTYRKSIERACGNMVFTPYMTLFFRQFSRKELIELSDDLFAVKLYPAGITTQSAAGVSDFKAVEETISLLEELGIPLLVHGESNGFVMDREREFIDVLKNIVEKFPRLHLVMEHITTAEAVEFVDRYTQVTATVTLHHLMITLDDVIGGLMQPHLFCKPIAKTPRDLEALRKAVLEGHPRIVFGSDSAPHPRHRKESCGCAAGIFSAPIALAALAEIFEDADRLEYLESFVCSLARERYKVKPPDKKIVLERSPFTVPESYGDITPFLAGKKLRWKVTIPSS